MGLDVIVVCAGISDDEESRQRRGSKQSFQILMYDFQGGGGKKNPMDNNKRLDDLHVFLIVVDLFVLRKKNRSSHRYSMSKNLL